MKQYTLEQFKTKLNKIYCCECLKGMQAIPDKSVDLIITDPPYGINYSSFRTHSKKLENDNQLNWVSDFFSILSDKVKKDTHLYVFVDPEMMPNFCFSIRKYWKVRNFLTIPRAVKGNGGDRIFQQQFEFCIFATKGKGKKFNQTQILKPSRGYIKDKRYSAKEWLYRLPDNWYWTKASEHNLNRLHPTQKSVECIKYMIQLSSNKNDIILDPFMGSGTTAVACKNLGRNFIGFEISQEYVNIANKRLSRIKD